ncbi:unnamed protein product [Rotaria sordida]|uniref:Uncharacterized protein n=1 Tax=Rotaria sordida TaxID=392033 RepID=A0A819NKC7_9BILA|nr:unnamed protein product [Rotaria sordida]CAF3999619.1 unnamed protein product [Rotaria sordida]
MLEYYYHVQQQIYELIDKLTQCWQLNNHTQYLFKDDLSTEQFILFPHGLYLRSTDSLVVTNDSTSTLDLSSRKQSHSSLIIIRKRNNLSETEVNNESIGINNSSVSLLATTTISTNKSNLARLGILLAGKQAACNNNNANNYDGSTFTLIDSTEDEADSNISLFKQ